MGVDASAIGGLGYPEPISKYHEFWKDRGITLLEEEQYDIDALIEALEKSDLTGVRWTYTYGYNDSELFAFVAGDTVDELIENVPLYIESMNRLGIEPNRERLQIQVISFFS